MITGEINGLSFNTLLILVTRFLFNFSGSTHYNPGRNVLPNADMRWLTQQD